MKNLTILFSLVVAFAANANECELMSGAFQTTSEECKYSHDGINFYSEGHKKITLSYDDVTKKFDVVMDTDNFSLHYLADGNEQVGRPYFEGDTYVAQCNNNEASIRGLFELLRFPLIKKFTMSSYDKLIYRETFEGDSFIRICEMERSKK